MMMEESIYNIIPPAEKLIVKPAMYRSHHNSAAPPSCSTFGVAGSKPGVSNIAGETQPEPSTRKADAFGQPSGEYRVEPENYLKKSSKSNKVQTLAQVKKAAPEQLQPSIMKTRTKPLVPAVCEKPVLGLKSKKNFIVVNAVDNILRKPNIQPVAEPNEYKKKGDYGKVPAYLTKIKSDIEDEYNYIQRLQKEEEDQNTSVRVMAEEEREMLIKGLKEKWEKVNLDYQATTHMTKLDTVGKVKRKEQYEATLAAIEKDISRLNRKYIFVDANA